MTEQEKKQKLYHIYAVIGEFTTHRKQKLQEIQLFDERIKQAEEELVEIINTKTEEVEKPKEAVE